MKSCTDSHPQPRLAMPRRNRNPDTMTAADEIRAVLAWAEHAGFVNIAAALRRALAKWPEDAGA
jgi:hypothetical protein